MSEEKSNGNDLADKRLSDIPDNHPLVEYTRKRLEEFRVRNGLHFSPKVNLDACIKKIAKHNGECLCHPHIQCPCVTALDEIRRDGMCDCKLFVDEKMFIQMGGKL